MAGAADHPAAWPRIEGIASEVVREQLGGDARLFLVLLARLLDDFADLHETAASASGETLDLLRRRMHRLKGSSGSLGAMRVFALADRAEQACAAMDVEEGRKLALTAAAELETLRAAVACAVAATADPARPAGHPGRVDPAEITSLIALLRGKNLAAVGRFDSIEGRIQPLIGAETAALLRAHIDNLRFDAAADLLGRLVSG